MGWNHTCLSAFISCVLFHYIIKGSFDLMGVSTV